MTLSEQALMYNQRLRDVLQLIVNELNQGQQKKLVRNAEIKALLDRYGVQYAELDK